MLHSNVGFNLLNAGKHELLVMAPHACFIAKKENAAMHDYNFI